jgi:hypothetical protein
MRCQRGRVAIYLAFLIRQRRPLVLRRWWLLVLRRWWLLVLRRWWLLVRTGDHLAFQSRPANPPPRTPTSAGFVTCLGWGRPLLPPAGWAHTPPAGKRASGIDDASPRDTDTSSRPR